MENRILKILIKRLAEFIIFLLILVLLNLAIIYWDIIVLKGPIGFLTQSVPFIGLIALIMLFGEIFSVLRFPFNLPYPLFNAFGALLMIYFIFEVFLYLIELGQLDLGIPLDIIFLVILILVVAIILITGYYSILSEFYKQQKRKSEDDDSENEEDEEVKEPIIKPKKKVKTKKAVKIKKKVVKKKIKRK